MKIKWLIAMAIMVLVAGCSKDDKNNYTGWLEDGTKFDSSLNPGREPLRFTLGAGQMIQGFDQGILGMKVGGKRKLTIPPNLAYGSQDKGIIPPNSTLIFELDLLIVE